MKDQDKISVKYAQGATIFSYVPAVLEIYQSRIKLTSVKAGEPSKLIFDLNKDQISKVMVGRNNMQFKLVDKGYNIGFSNLFIANKWLIKIKNLGIKTRNYNWILFIPPLMVVVLFVWLLFFNH